MKRPLLRRRPQRLLALGLLVAAVTATGSVAAAKLKGTITVDGSSTVAPYTAAAAETFQKLNKDVHVTVAISGTGGGFQRFCNGETDLSDASRPISQKNEVPNCVKNGVKYVAFTIANDGISIVVNKDNNWIKNSCLSTGDLKRIWEPGSKIDNWKDLDPSYPDQKLKLFGPGTDSGTFDFFTKAINGKEKASRSDYSPSENDNALVAGVEGEKGGLGYFGYSYYADNKSKLKLIAINSGSGCIAPNKTSVQSGRYRPLSRALFIYAKRSSFKRGEVQGFLGYIFQNEKTIASRAHLISLTDRQLKKARYQFEQAKKSN